MNAECGELSTFMAELQEFEPYAYFDKHMDCIRVKLADCSVTERRMNRIFTMLVPNDSAMGDKAVGVTIKGVAHLFDRCGLPMVGIVSLASIIDAIVKCFRDASAVRIQEEMATAISKLQVNFDDAEVVAA